MAPMLAVETFPYSRLELSALSPTNWSHGPQILEVEEQQAAVVGDLEDQSRARRPGSRSD